MASIDDFSVTALMEAFMIMKPRALGSTPPQLAEKSNDFSEQQVVVLRALTTTAATISIIAGLLSLYWFLRMRRTFRHHLIMLLIASNFQRALWYFFFPIVSFTRGSVQASSHFCQASGFLLSFGIEGADYVVLVMAIHASLCIFKPKTSLGEPGLYKYRYAVYGLWIALPALAAALAFINPAGAYVTSGTYCYLPIRPFWFRLALAWIPRYLILIGIAAMYLAIYFFVRHNFAQFNLSEHPSDKNPSAPVESNTSMSKSKHESAAETIVSAGTPFMSQQSTIRHSSEEKGRESSGPAWENYTFGLSSPIPKMPDTDTVKVELPDMTLADLSNSPASESRRETLAIIRALQNSHPPESSEPLPEAAQSLAPLRLTNSHNQPVETENLRARYRAIRRQMRFLFIYPVVYLIIWIIPFVQHCLDYSDSYAAHPNFGLTCASTVILALQCTADSILFTMREKPWRHGDDGNHEAKTFLGSLSPWKQTKPRSLSRSVSAIPTSRFKRSLSALGSFNASRVFQSDGSGTRGSGNAGKSKGERVAEARVARQRKGAEVAQARQAAEDQRQRRKMSFARRAGRDRSWWEEEGKKRKDSVMLGTDGDGAGPAGTTARPRAKTVVDTIGEEPEKEEEDAMLPGDASPETQLNERAEGEKPSIFFKPWGASTSRKEGPSEEDNGPLARPSQAKAGPGSEPPSPTTVTAEKAAETPGEEP